MLSLTGCQQSELNSVEVPGKQNSFPSFWDLSSCLFLHKSIFCSCTRSSQHGSEVSSGGSWDWELKQVPAMPLMSQKPPWQEAQAKNRHWEWGLGLENSSSGAVGSAGGRGEVREGAERDKSPGIKLGRKFSGGTWSGESEGREEKLPILPFHSEPSKAEIRAKSFYWQTQWSSDLKCARTPRDAPGSGNK